MLKWGGRNLNPYHIPGIKSYLKWILHLNVRAETKNILEAIVEENIELAKERFLRIQKHEPQVKNVTNWTS